MTEENVDELDLSWTNEYLRTLHGGITYDKEPMTHVNVHVYYSNVDDIIFHDEKIKQPLTIQSDYNSSSLLQNDLLSLIQQHRNFNNKKYKCDGIMKFHITENPSAIIDHVCEEDFQFSPNDCIQTYDLPCTLDFPGSLFIFHSINSIHILFRELILVNKKSKTIPPILRKQHGKYTKKRVRIAELPETRKTRKHL